MLIKINTDNLFISERIREIDKNYYIVFNTKKKKYEIHNKSQGELNTYCLTLPFDILDYRTVEYIEKTKIENIEKLIAEIDKENEKKIMEGK